MNITYFTPFKFLFPKLELEEDIYWLVNNQWEAASVKNKMLPKCEIVATTKGLKQVVKEYGNEWFLLQPLRRVSCFDNAMGALIVSKCRSHQRWVRYPSQIMFV